jgi:hypothetical protein
MLEQLEGMEAALADTEGWTTKLHALIANKAHELQHPFMCFVGNEGMEFCRPPLCIGQSGLHPLQLLWSLWRMKSYHSKISVGKRTVKPLSNPSFGKRY